MKFKFLVSLFCLPLFLSSQNIVGGFAIGKSVYWGDLNAPAFSTNISKNGGLAFQVFAKKYIGNYLGLKANLMTGIIKGNDANSTEQWQKERNLNFKNRLFEFSITGEYYFFGHDPQSNDKPFSPYVLAGIAIHNVNPTTVYNGSTYQLRSLGTEGQGMPNYDKKYKPIGMSLPFGAGAIFRASESFDLHVDILARRSFTDYIDDVSKNYVNYNELTQGNGQLAAALADRTNEFKGAAEPYMRDTGTQRGGAQVKDWYFTAMVGISFTIAEGDEYAKRRSRHKTACPKF